MDQTSQNIVLIKNSTTPSLAYLNLNTIFEFLEQYTRRCIAYIIFQKGADNF